MFEAHAEPKTALYDQQARNPPTAPKSRYKYFTHRLKNISQSSDISNLRVRIISKLGWLVLFWSISTDSSEMNVPVLFSHTLSDASWDWLKLSMACKVGKNYLNTYNILLPGKAIKLVDRHPDTSRHFEGHTQWSLSMAGHLWALFTQARELVYFSPRIHKVSIGPTAHWSK